MSQNSTPPVPPLAGLCSFDDARRTELPVEECVAWMKRHHYVLHRLHGVFTARLTAEPLYELKTAFSHHAYLCAEHVTALRKRVSELREPPLGLEAVPHRSLERCLDEVLAAPTTSALLLGLYEALVPALIDSLERYIATTNLLADAPSVRIARFCKLEMEDLQRFGAEAIAAVVSDEDRASLVDWLTYLRGLLADAGGLDGRDEPPASSDGSPRFSATPYVYDGTPKRDARFHDSYNAGVNPEAFLYDERFSPRDKVLMMYYKRLRELDVPEMMASILHETPGKPWKFYADMSRQLWDEARHSLLGEVGFVDLGLDWTRIPINFTWSLNLNTQLTPRERHAVLFFIEQGLMPRTGKRYEWEIGRQSEIPLAALIQDFDWADEVLHAQLGREWYVADFGDLKPAMEYGDRCWSQVLSHWRDYRDKGLTDHRNWWPDLYRAACEHWGVAPDPQALGFCETYEDKRADLKGIEVRSEE
ncbi:MAG: hypothetical protein H0T47_08805 [Planctomycetaceae bacterium]|nr:hypothetical protein [Planctomycetaceae bacterium]